MRHTKLSAIFALATLLLPFDASAQQGPPISDVPRPAHWDVDASFGWFVRDQSDWAAAAYGIDVGRYWTSQVKIDAGVILLGQHRTGDTERFPVAELPNGGDYYTDKTLALTTFSVAATYQFRENVFAHPYVSSGFRFGWLREHRFRDQRVYTDYIPGPYPQKPINYVVPALDEHNAQLLTRPFVAAGSKFYFNERIYVRPEALVTFGGQVRELTYRIAFGTDF